MAHTGRCERTVKELTVLEMLAKVVLGVVLVAAGVVMLVVPGPGLLVIAIGLVLVLSQFDWGERVLARVRVWLRDRFGSPRVQAFERRMPRDMFPPADTEELRLRSLRRRLEDDQRSRDSALDG